MTKTYTFFIFMVVLTFAGCTYCNRKNIKQQGSMMFLNDSAVIMIQKAQLNGDTVMLRTAIRLLDAALAIDTTLSNRYMYYQNKSIVLALLGDSIGADRERELAFRLLPFNHIDRLIYFGEKFRKNNLRDSASFYLSLAMEQCNYQLSQKYDVNLVVKKAQILVFQGKKTQALNYIRQKHKDHPNDEIIYSLVQEMEH